MYSLPANASSNDAQWLVPHLILLVKHEPVRGTQLGRQSTLSVIDSPFQLFHCDEYLPENGIDPGLATVKAGDSHDCVLVVKYEPGKVEVSYG